MEIPCISGMIADFVELLTLITIYYFKVDFMQLVVTKSNTLNAFSWIKQGWRLFTLQPGPFMAMSALVIFISLFGQTHRIFEIIVVFLSPFLAAGYYLSASRAEQGEKLVATDLFALLSEMAKYKVFIRLATFSVLLSLPLAFVAEDIRVALEQGLLPQFEHSLLFVSMMAINFMLFAFAVPAAWISPETPALELVKQSFKACWINVMPLTVYGLIIFILAIISIPIILVGWLIVYSISVLSFYQMFLTIYQPVQEAPQTDEISSEQDNEEQVEVIEDDTHINDQDHVQQESDDRTDNR